MSQDQLEFSPLHCIFFIYYTFASYNNGKLKDVEKKSIVTLLNKWTSNTEISSQIINDTLHWSSQNIKTPDHALQTMFSMIGYLKGQNNFNIHDREIFLLDIRNISRSDDDFSETEKKWHDMIAAQLDVNLRISNTSSEVIAKENKKIERRPIGYRMSYRKN